MTNIKVKDSYNFCINKTIKLIRKSKFTGNQESTELSVPKEFNGINN